jgi:hypothetical protein
VYALFGDDVETQAIIYELPRHVQPLIRNNYNPDPVVTARVFTTSIWNGLFLFTRLPKVCRHVVTSKVPLHARLPLLSRPGSV